MTETADREAIAATPARAVPRTSSSAPEAGSTSPGWFGNGIDRDPPTARNYRMDVYIALALAAGTSLSTWLYGVADMFDHVVPLWVNAIAVVLSTLPLALRRRYPIAVALIVSATFIGAGIAGVQEFLFLNITLFTAIYSVGAWSRHRLAAAIARGAIIAAMLIWLVLAIVWQSAFGAVSEDAETVANTATVTALNTVNLITNVLFFGGAYFFGDNSWNAAVERRTLRRRSQELEEERQISSAQAVALERLRIARELHDVVAHHVSVMGVQAAAAGRVLQRDPEKAAASLGAIEDSARQAVQELHQLVHTLRDSESGIEGNASTVSLERIDALVDELRELGLRVEVTRIGEPHPLPSTSQLAVYRLVQEALTNVRKHSREQAADVRLRYREAELEVEVSNEGLVPRASTRRGFGLLGMRERIEAVGGTFTAGPKPRGGWRVRAEVPYREGVASRSASARSGGVAAAAPNTTGESDV